jgi:hypothetical protein
MAPPRNSAAPASVLRQTKDIIASISFDLLLGKVAGFTTALVGAYLSARKIQEALRASAGAEALKNQLVALGMSAAAAETKIASLSKMAASGAVSFESLGNAVKILRVIGGAAADTEGNLRRISDVFAASGAPVASVATAYAQFYQAIKQGGDAGAAAQDMANLGGISQDAAAKIRDLSAAGASSGQMLRALQSAMDPARGASDALASSVVGLQAQLKNLEQENNVKIGDKFLEGEKAGLRAALAFEKLKGSLQSGIADSIAPISNAWAELKEKIISSEGAVATVKGLGVAIQALIVIAGGVTISAFGQGLAFLGTVAAKIIPSLLTVAGATGVFRTALTATLAVVRGGLGILTSAAAGWAIFGMAIAKVGMDALEATQKINKLTEEAQKSSEAKQNQVAENNKKIATIRTPEERQRVVQDLDNQLEDLQAQRAENDKKLQAAQESTQKNSTEGRMVPWWLGGTLLTNDWKLAYTEQAKDQAALGAAQGEAARLDAQEGMLKRQRLQAINQKGLGVDSAEDQRLRQKMLLERQIREEATQSLQSSLSPELGLEIGQSELQRLQGNYAMAEKAAPKAAVERRELNQLEMNVTASENAQKFSEGLDKLQNFAPETKAAELDQDAILRTTLREERAKQQYISSNTTSTNAQKKEARERLEKINQVISEKFGGDVEQISAAKTQEIERKRDDEIKQMDPNQILQQITAQSDRNQQFRVASGAKAAALQKEKERADLEQQLASLSDSGANAEFKAGASGNLRIDQLEKARAAAEELEKKTQEYKESIGTPQQDQKKREVEQAQVAAAKAGTEGRTTAEIDQELNAEKQILQTKLSAARIAENAAKAEYDAANRRLALERQIVELRANQAQQLMGEGYGGKGENEIRGEGQDKEIAQKEQALAAAKARDAADAAAKANPTEQNNKTAQEARERAAALGVTDATNTRDVEAQLQELRQQRAQTAVNQVNQNNRSSVEMQIQGARIQERYAPNSQASQSAKELADKLEDQLSKADRVKELTSQGMKGENAERVADIEVQRSRILSNMEKEGRPEVSSMARIGGASGWVGMVGGATQDKQARLESLNQQMVQLLRVLASDSTQGMSLYRTLLNNNK